MASFLRMLVSPISSGQRAVAPLIKGQAVIYARTAHIGATINSNKVSFVTLVVFNDTKQDGGGTVKTL